MRILLFGEYSRFHTSLKEGLLELGHEVVVAGNNDFKNYPLDISFYARYFKDYYILNKFRQAVFRIFKLDLAQIETALRFYRKKDAFRDFDIVQLVNEYPIGSTVFWEKKIIGFLAKNNKSIYVSSCGDDYVCVRYMLENKLRYSTLTPCLSNPDLGHCKYSLLYMTPRFKKLHEFVFQNTIAVIPGDLDYAIPLEGNQKSAGLIPYPINTDKHTYAPVKIDGPIVIFHGINEANYFKKGNDYFEKALQVISGKYPGKVDITTVRSVPYPEYISLYNSCHILLDQVFSYDQGYNALEAMAKGKVVFTGAEKEFHDYYELSDKVAINAVPDVKSIVDELSFLIENPEEISKMGLRARQFVEKEHQYVKIAQKYLTVWNNGIRN